MSRRTRRIARRFAPFATACFICSQVLTPALALSQGAAASPSAETMLAHAVHPSSGVGRNPLVETMAGIGGFLAATVEAMGLSVLAFQGQGGGRGGGGVGAQQASSADGGAAYPWEGSYGSIKRAVAISYLYSHSRLDRKRRTACPTHSKP